MGLRVDTGIKLLHLGHVRGNGRGIHPNPIPIQRRTQDKGENATLILPLRLALYFFLGLTSIGEAMYLEPILLLPSTPFWAVIIFYLLINSSTILIAVGMEGREYERRSRN